MSLFISLVSHYTETGGMLCPFIPTQSFFTHNSLVSGGECSGRKSVKKIGALDCVVLHSRLGRD